jgi:hypothetical protein
MDKLKYLFLEQLYHGLEKQSIAKCSDWAQRYRIMGQPFPGPYRFTYHPWVKQMHDDESPFIVGQKGAQVGFTEVALNKAFYAIDIKLWSVFYVLPASIPDATDFSASRFDVALELSNHLNKLFSETKNIGHKRAGNCNFFLRGSRSRSQLKSLPINLLILDELDEMVQENISLALERLSGQKEKQVFMLSTPTIENTGINAYYRESTQASFTFSCPHCNQYITLQYPDSIKITAEHLHDQRINDTHLICYKCHKKLDHETKTEWLAAGQWVEQYPGRNIKGYHVNQLYSTTVTPVEFAIAYFKAQSNPSDEQEFFNNKVGITHTVEGAKITDQHIQSCTKEFVKHMPLQSTLITMGIDVGKWIHYEVDDWLFTGALTSDINLLAIPRILAEGKVLNFEDLVVIMRDYKVLFSVIDAQPEKRKAFELAQQLYGRIKLCYYTTQIQGKQIVPSEEHAIQVDRTSWLDLSLGRFKNQTIDLPQDLSIEYKNNIKALVRVYKKDQSGNPIGVYVKNENDADHFAHARNYSEIALKFAATLASSQTIKGIL